MAAPPDALEPVRAGLLRTARAEAAAVLDGARAEAEEVLRAARTTAEESLARARDLGTADGAAAARRERTRAVQDAWTAELAARAEVYARLRDQVRAGVRRALAEDTGRQRRLTRTARALLGPGARVAEAPGGGVTAEVPGRRADLSADALADRALDRLGARAETLWGPP
ncbi:hypothetical protein AB5J52_04080 [Streptomyces sp. R39]|uniref:ATP synthase E subunit n=1 Tax=Streptomyces sp. R39 TaxID=3238631 RepID=A0AB39QFU7_9ACTN|nr:hypothetical protein [Streptomyces shenzhenensis]